MYEEVLYEVDDPVATIRLNRPEKLNAITDRMGRELKHAIAQAEEDERVVGIVLTGAGRGFCAGADLGALQQIQAAGDIAAMRTGSEFADARPGDQSMGPDYELSFSYLLSVRKPVIAAVNGAAAGLGFALAMMCDVRFASEQAVFLTAFAQRGLVAEHGTSWILPRLIGPSRALDILWSGRRFDAVEAMQMGFVNRVVPAEALLDDTKSYVRELAATSAPASLMQMKQQIYSHLMRPLGAAMQDTERRMDASYSWPEFKEGIASFVEKRPPSFARIVVKQ